MDEALLAGRLIPLRELSRGFYRDGKIMLLAYEQSNSIVQYIIVSYGVESLLEILHLLSKGRPLEKETESEKEFDGKGQIFSNRRQGTNFRRGETEKETKNGREYD